MRRRLLLVFALCAPLAAASPSSAAPGPTAARQLSTAVARAHTFVLPRGTTHFALHWPRRAGTVVLVRLSRDGRRKLFLAVASSASIGTMAR